MGSLRQKFRLGIVVLAGIVAGSQAVGAIQAWLQYREWRERDSSAAGALLTLAQADAILAAICVAIAAAAWWLLRPGSGTTKA